jgi:hypothetical protein
MGRCNSESVFIQQMPDVPIHRIVHRILLILILEYLYECVSVGWELLTGMYSCLYSGRRNRMRIERPQELIALEIIRYQPGKIAGLFVRQPVGGKIHKLIKSDIS